MNDPAGISAIPELNGRNWRQWFIRMENYLRIHGLWEVTQNDPFKGKKTYKEKLAETDKYIYEKVEQARCRIVNTMDEQHTAYVRNCASAHEAWQVLQNLYQNTSALRESELKDKLNKTRKRNDTTIDEYMNQIITIVDELRQVNVNMTEEEVAHTVLDGLPDSYHMVVLTLKHYHEPLTMARVRLSLTYEENYQRKGRLYMTQEHEEVPFPSRNRPRCQFCRRIGHTLHQCTKFRSTYPSKEYLNDEKTETEGGGCMSLMATTPQLKTNDQQVWVIDSGATWHMTGNRNFIKPETEKPYNATIEIADGTHLVSQSMGTGILTLSNDNNTYITLKNLIYVPGLTANLLSVTCMTNNGASVIFKGGTCSIIQGKQTIQAKADSNSNYCLTATAKIWHKRLGHIHANRIKKLQLPHNMTESCETCIENKQSAAKFKSKDYQYEPLDLLYMDVVGPIQPATPAGQKYFLSVLDHGSKTSLVFLMSKKGSAERYAKLAINILEQKANQNRKVKAIRTDRGQEFLGRGLADYLAERGILHEKTAGYTPQQNDAERLHRDIREHASAMLNETNLPKKYWGEAVRTYVHIRNRVPPTQGEDTQTPLEKLSGRKPSTNHLKVFGCEAWVLKPEGKIGGKFEPKSEKGIFIGYENTATYRVLLNNRLATSRNVRFNEEKMGEYNRPETNEPTAYCDDLGDEPDQWETSSNESDNEAEEGQNELQNTENEEIEDEQKSTYNLRPRKPTSLKGYTATGLPDKFDGYKSAMQRPDKELWMEAIQNELDSLSNMRTWEITEIPKERKPIGTKWIFRVKRDEQNNIMKYKARLVALGCHQKPGVDYEEIYASVVSKTALRIFLAAVNQLNLHLHQMDIETAFLNAELEEEVYLRIPDGFTQTGVSQVLKFNKSLYGLKQAPRAWNKELTQTLKKLNFECIEVDQSVLTCTTSKGMCILYFYVDDILIASKELDLIHKVKNLISKIYKATDLGEAKHFLGITIQRDRTNRILDMNQTNKINDYIQQHGVENSKAKDIPLSVPIDNTQTEEIQDQLTYQKNCWTTPVPERNNKTRPDTSSVSTRSIQ